MTAQERLSLLIEVLSVVTVPVALSLGIAGASEESLQVLLDDAFDDYETMVGVPHPLDDQDEASPSSVGYCHLADWEKHCASMDAEDAA